MLVNELKCIEVLMQTLVNNTSLSTQILSVFDNPRDYKRNKNNLFNLISIKKLLTYYHDNLPFSLQAFLNTGIIPGHFNEPCVVPTIYETSSNDIEEIFKHLIEAFSSDQYIFDTENTIYVSSPHIEASIPQIWLHRLAQGSKQTVYEHTYLFQKGNPRSIKDKDDLNEYLRRTKSFIVRLSSSDPNANYEKDFNKAKKTVDSFLRGERSVRVENIIELIHHTLPKQYKIETHRLKLEDSYWLVQKVNQMGPEFYHLSISEQEKCLNDWILEHFNSSELANLEAQRFILQADQAVNLNVLENINVNSALSGLFSLYMNIIASEPISLDTVSLSAFRIKKYVPESKQILRSTRNAYTTAILKKGGQAEQYRQRLNELYDEIGRLDIIKDFALIAEKKEESLALLEKYKAAKESTSELTNKREEINSYEDSLPANSVETIAFDNERIIALINRATIKGNIYVSGRDLVIEDYNPAFAEPVFKVMININKLIELIENINFTLEEATLQPLDQSSEYDLEKEFKKAS